jgi:hypothetical protein
VPSVSRDPSCLYFYYLNIFLEMFVMRSGLEDDSGEMQVKSYLKMGSDKIAY